MTEPFPPAVARVAAVLERHGLIGRIRLTTATARSAEDAAIAIGCTISQIAKSLVFQLQSSRRPVLAVVSGSHQLDTSALAPRWGEPLVKPNADFVRTVTGFSIGGIPPIALAEPMLTVLDRELMAFDNIWAAAGAPNAVFHLTPNELHHITGAEWADITLR